MKVSISCLVYNHEPFIRQTIESILAQKVNFDYEILIHDDASTDNSQNIIREYTEKYPDIIKPIYQTENQFSKGVDIGCKYNLPRAKGKYIALCDGDDYWIDPYKLQKQVDFLDSHTDYALCCHRALVKYEDSNRAPHRMPDDSIFTNNISYELLLETNFIVTSSVMYRLDNRVISALTNEVPKDILPYDWYTYFLIVNGQKIKLMEDVMSVYRINPQSIWSDFWEDREKVYLSPLGLKYAKFFYYHWNNILNRDIKYKDMIMANIKPIFYSNLLHYNKETCEAMKEMFPEFDFYSATSDIPSKEYKREKKYQRLWVIFMILSFVFAFVALLELFI